MGYNVINMSILGKLFKCFLIFRIFFSFLKAIFFMQNMRPPEHM